MRTFSLKPIKFCDFSVTTMLHLQASARKLKIKINFTFHDNNDPKKCIKNNKGIARSKEVQNIKIISK